MPLAPEQNKPTGWQADDARKLFPLLPQIARRSLLTHPLNFDYPCLLAFLYIFLNTAAAALLLCSIREILTIFCRMGFCVFM